MKMKKLILLLVYACWFVGGICFFSSCQRQLDANEKIVKVSVDQADEEYLASSFIRNYKIIPLETNENCLLSSIDKIKKVNEGSNKTDSYATIETAVDFEKLENVLVITNQ